MIKKKPAPEFLVVYEDVWNNKDAYRTKKIGTTIAKILKEHNLNADYDKEKLNSDYPYYSGTFGPGFYDIECYEQEEGDSGIEGEYAGRIFIFAL